MKRSSLDWRLLSSAALFIFALVLIWPTVNWFSKPEIERDRAEASIQPETDNPHFISLLEEMRAEGGEETLAHYRDLYEESKGTIRLGLDLQGGMYLSYIIEPVGGLDPSEAIEQALETEAEAQAICMQTEDFKIAYHAFVAKQTPKFIGN